MGITLAAEAIKARNVEQNVIKILSNNISVLQTLGIADINSALIYDCHTTLEKGTQWVPRK